jgi:Tol biopolymer transport system component
MGFNERREIVIADAATGAAQALTNNWYDDDVPRWSPDGTRIAFLGNDTVVRDHWFLHVGWADGRGESQISSRLVHRSDFSAEFSWNGDGTEIAISTEEDPKKWVIYAIRADGSGERYVTEKYAERLMSLHWSPNGQSITYATLQVEVVGEGQNAEENWRWDFFVVNGDGSDDRYLFTLPGEDKDWRTVKWSPDSQWIAIYDCRSSGGGNAQLYLHNVYGGVLNYAINQVPGAPFGPVWSYDRQKMLMNTMDGIYVSDLNGANRFRLIAYAVVVGWLP